MPGRIRLIFFSCSAVIVNEIAEPPLLTGQASDFVFYSTALRKQLSGKIAKD